MQEVLASNTCHPGLDPGSRVGLREWRMDKLYTVYIMTNRERGVFYTGVTSDLMGRVWTHREQEQDGFVKRYNLRRLVWFETHEDVHAAIAREKTIKRWSREWKIELIKKTNPDWRNLWFDLSV